MIVEGRKLKNLAEIGLVLAVSASAVNDIYDSLGGMEMLDPEFVKQDLVGDILKATSGQSWVMYREEETGDTRFFPEFVAGIPALLADQGVETDGELVAKTFQDIETIMNDPDADVDPLAIDLQRHEFINSFVLGLMQVKPSQREAVIDWMIESLEGTDKQDLISAIETNEALIDYFHRDFVTSSLDSLYSYFDENWAHYLLEDPEGNVMDTLNDKQGIDKQAYIYYSLKVLEEYQGDLYPAKHIAETIKTILEFAAENTDQIGVDVQGIVESSGDKYVRDEGGFSFSAAYFDNSDLPSFSLLPELNSQEVEVDPNIALWREFQMKHGLSNEVVRYLIDQKVKVTSLQHLEELGYDLPEGGSGIQRLGGLNTGNIIALLDALPFTDRMLIFTKVVIHEAAHSASRHLMREPFEDGSTLTKRDIFFQRLLFYADQDENSEVAQRYPSYVRLARSVLYGDGVDDILVTEGEYYGLMHGVSEETHKLYDQTNDTNVLYSMYGKSPVNPAEEAYATTTSAIWQKFDLDQIPEDMREFYGYSLDLDRLEERNFGYSKGIPKALGKMVGLILLELIDLYGVAWVKRKLGYAVDIDNEDGEEEAAA